MRAISSRSRGPGNTIPICLLLSLCFAPAFAQDSVRGRPSNPHGPLKTRCEDCHTTTAWKPIRRQPEFNHDALLQALPRNHASLVELTSQLRNLPEHTPQRRVERLVNPVSFCVVSGLRSTRCHRFRLANS